MFVLALILAGAAGFLAWLLFERPRIQYGELKSPRVLASALWSTAPGHEASTAASAQRPQSRGGAADAGGEPWSEQPEQDVEAMVRRHLYGPRSG